MKIWKYKLNESQSTQTIEMPEGAKILSVCEQYGQPTIWAAVDPDAKKVGRKIQLVATGELVELNGMSFVGTCVTGGGPIVCHVFAD